MATKYLDYNGLLYFWQKIKVLFAPLASPSFTGTPTAPTATTGTSNSQVATTEFVANTVGAMTSGVSDVKVDGTSVVSSGVATIPKTDSNTFGVAKIRTGSGSPTSLGFIGIYGGSSLNSGNEVFVPRIVNSKIDSSLIDDATTSAKGLMSSTDKTKLDSITMTNGKIDSSVLPSYVDDVIEAYARDQQTALSQNWLSATSASGAALTPETGKIYVLMNDTPSYAANSQFRWGGNTYVKLADGGVSSITNGEIDTIVAS